MRLPILTFAMALIASGPAFADFTISFEWGDIPLCTTGRPNKVDSPKFVLKGVPDGTSKIEFRLIDLDVPSYNHGGGKLNVSADGIVAKGAFKYKSPCPPDGTHTYEWRASAKTGAQVLGKTAARRDYPE